MAIEKRIIQIRCVKTVSYRKVQARTPDGKTVTGEQEVAVERISARCSFEARDLSGELTKDWIRKEIDLDVKASDLAAIEAAASAAISKKFGP